MERFEKHQVRCEPTTSSELLKILAMKRDGLIKMVRGAFDSVEASIRDHHDGGRIDHDALTPHGEREQLAGCHILKCWPQYFDLLWTGKKRAEVRVNDRNYREGDFLVLREFDPTRAHSFADPDRACSGRWIVARVASVVDLSSVLPFAEGPGSPVLLSLDFGYRGDGLGVAIHAMHAGCVVADPRVHRLVRLQADWVEGLRRRNAHATADAQAGFRERTYRPPVARSVPLGDEGREPATHPDDRRTRATIAAEPPSTPDDNDRRYRGPVS